MKKCILILAIFVLVGCSADSPNSDSLLNPPEWLYGSWEDERSQNTSFTQMEIEVTKDNIKIISGEGLVIYDIGGMVKNMNNAPNGSASIMDESITINSYKFTLGVELENAEIQRTVYNFQRIDDETIIFYQNNVSLELFKVN